MMSKIRQSVHVLKIYNDIVELVNEILLPQI